MGARGEPVHVAASRRVRWLQRHVPSRSAEVVLPEDVGGGAGCRSLGLLGGINIDNTFAAFGVNTTSFTAILSEPLIINTIPVCAIVCVIFAALERAPRC